MKDYEKDLKPLPNREEIEHLRGGLNAAKDEWFNNSETMSREHLNRHIRELFRLSNRFIDSLEQVYDRKDQEVDSRNRFRKIC